MKRLFDLDAPIVQAVGTLGTLMLLNVWWLVCCLPVVTAGAATAAMYSCLFDLRLDRKADTRTFFRAFRENFKKPTCIWLLLLAGAAALFGLYWLILLFEGSELLRLVFLAGFCVLFVMWAVMLLYSMALTAYFEDTVRGTLRNALFMGLHHLRQTIPVIALTLLPLLCWFISPRVFLYTSYLWLFVLPGLQLHWKAGLLQKVFEQYKGS